MKQQELLKASFKAGKFSHAYLLSGNDAQGKERTIQEILREQGCQDMYSHPDVVVVKPLVEDGESAREITIGQVRDLISRMSLGAWSMPLTFALIFDAHSLNEEAQSALLKLLEDAKEHAVFFLLTQHPFLILPTVRSRAQEIRFWKFDSFSDSHAPEAQVLQKLQKQTLRERFAFAKELSESSSRTNETLDAWIAYARIRMLEQLEKDARQAKRYSAFISALQECKRVLQQTNANPRMVLEQVMLEF
ncbi:MAG: hypothetical protein HYT50_00940 [Candidatus Wildermuthbacteria bacterium]|nr:hypothetical protein [Candidatus Wildermuthbacteria bacterium]